MDEEEHQRQEVGTIVSDTCWLFLFIPRLLFIDEDLSVWARDTAP